MSSYGSNISNKHYRSSGILNVGKHEFLVSSVLENSNLPKDDFDNYDTLDTFEACKLNFDLKQLAQIVNQQNSHQIRFASQGSVVDENENLAGGKYSLKNYYKSFTQPLYKYYKKTFVHDNLTPEADILDPCERNLDSCQQPSLGNPKVLKNIPTNDVNRNEAIPELYFGACNYRYNNLHRKGDDIDFKKIEFHFDDEDAAKEPLVFRKVRKRLINKYGSTNVVQSNISKRKQSFLSDIYTTLLDAKWRWSVLIFTLGFILSWTIFAIIWYLIALTHGDFQNVGNLDFVPCVVHCTSFTAIFLFSIETQHTTGYGFRHITPECPEAILLFMIQSITGAMIQGFVIGLIFNKLSRPKKRAATLIFSKNAVICTRDGVLCLLIRIGDMRKSHIIDARTRAYLYRKKITLEGEVISLHPEPMDLNFDISGRNDRIFLSWPSILVHEIRDDGNGKCSPLYNLGAQDLAEEKFEIVVILEGMIEASGMSMQARTSYLPNEILWGHRFSRLLTYVREDGDYTVDYSRFHETSPINMPVCSARDLDILRNKYAEERKKLNANKNPVVDGNDNNVVTLDKQILNRITEALSTLPKLMDKLENIETRLNKFPNTQLDL